MAAENPGQTVSSRASLLGIPPELRAVVYGLLHAVPDAAHPSYVAGGKRHRVKCSSQCAWNLGSGHPYCFIDNHREECCPHGFAEIFRGLKRLHKVNHQLHKEVASFAYNRYEYEFCSNVPDFRKLEDIQPGSDVLAGLNISPNRLDCCHRQANADLSVAQWKFIRAFHLTIEVPPTLSPPQAMALPPVNMLVPHITHLQLLDDSPGFVAILNELANIEVLTIHYTHSIRPDACEGTGEISLPQISTDPYMNYLSAFEQLRDDIELRIRREVRINFNAQAMLPVVQADTRFVRCTPLSRIPWCSDSAHFIAEAKFEENLPETRYVEQLTQRNGQARSKTFPPAPAYMWDDVIRLYASIKGYVGFAVHGDLPAFKAQHKEFEKKAAAISPLFWKAWEAHRKGDRREFETMRRKIAKTSWQLGASVQRVKSLAPDFSDDMVEMWKFETDFEDTVEAMKYARLH